MRQVDPVHRRAEADRLVEEDDLLVLRGETVGQAAHQVELGADRPLRAGRGRLQRLDDVLRRADVVRGGDDLVLALRVHEHVDAGYARPHVVDGLHREAPVHRAVPAPQDHLRVAQLLGGQAAVGLVRVVEDAVLQGHPHVPHGRVAAQVLVGEEQHLLPLLEGPLQGPLRVRRGADRAAVAAGEGLDVRGGVHVRDGHDLLGDAGLGQHVPALGDLLGGGHVGHRTARREVRQYDLLVVGGQDVRGLRHEVHAAEDDVLGLRTRRRVPGELERVAGHIRELDDLVALVVVPEDEDLLAQLLLGRAGALHQVRVGGGGQVAGAFDAALALGVGVAAEQEQGEGRRLDVEILDGVGRGHVTHPFFSAGEPFRLIDAIYHIRFTSL